MAIYYVKNGGSDSADGSSNDLAWETVGKVNGATLYPGDSVLFKRGSMWRESLTPPSNGTSGNPITFGAYDTGANPTLNGSNLVAGWTNYSGNVWQATVTQDPVGMVLVDGVAVDWKASIGALVNEYDSYWLANVLYLYALSDPDTFANPGVEAATRGNGVTFNNSYVTFDGLTVEKCTQGCFSAGNSGSNVIIANCVAQWGWNGIYANIGDPGSRTGDEFHDNLCRYNRNSGCELVYNLTSTKIYRNEFCYNDYYTHDSSGWTSGYKQFGQLDGAEIYENNIHHNGVAGQGNAGVGIWVDATWQYGQTPTNPTLIHHNLIHDNAGSGVFLEITSHNYVYGNVIYNCAQTGEKASLFGPAGIHLESRYDFITTDNLVYNNTIYGGVCGIKVTTDTRQAETEISHNIVRNNIVVGCDLNLHACSGGSNTPENGLTEYGHANVYENNCFGAEFTNFIDWAWLQRSTYDAWETAYGGPTHSVEADPLLTSPATGDLTLQATSPCIDAGVNLGATYQMDLRAGSVWPGQ